MKPITYSPTGRYDGLMFEWSGGAYVDVYVCGRFVTLTIPVWDYGANEPIVRPATVDGLRRCCEAWLAEHQADLDQVA